MTRMSLGSWLVWTVQNHSSDLWRTKTNQHCNSYGQQTSTLLVEAATKS